MKEKIKNSLLGFIIGDAIGVPYEFRGAGNYICKGFIGNGTHNQPKGTWSDDTSLMLTYLDCDNDIEKQKTNLVNWYKKGHYCCDNRLFDIGYTTAKAIESGFETKEDVYNNGNGSLLRVWPMAFLKEVSYDEVAAFSKLTHNHSINFQYSWFFILFLRNLFSLNKVKALKETELETGITINRKNNSNGGYIIDSVESSINYFMEADNFQDIVLRAVNNGEDTDSVGALSGALTGFYYGINIRNEVRNKEKYEKIIKKYVKITDF